MSTPVVASWHPLWFDLDQPLVVGRRDDLAFVLPGPAAGPGHELRLATHEDSTTWTATVVAIEHAMLGALREVATGPSGRYTFHLADGRQVVVDAEEGRGAVVEASPDLPVEEWRTTWPRNARWDLRVTLTDLEGPVAPAAAGR